ncbi:MAG: sigma-70 family RNA polymerase sigma factor [Acidobacteria bacterium]|nr:sigma-70 family RNA polymerase sigma factor [Acidobacteriota bacterium]MBI3657710.1 sigma-70 family RNA polymerase sigma factor [Acidobacteriota bacterium]
MLSIYFALIDSESSSIRKLIVLLVRVPRDEATWEEFFNRFSVPIYRTISVTYRKYHGSYSEDAVVDFAQDLCKRLIENNGRALLTFRGATEREFQAYLAEIGRNLVRDACLKASGRNLITLEMIAADDEISAQGLLPATEPDQDRVVQRLEFRDFVARSLGQICHGEKGERNCRIFILRHYEERSAHEVAEMFGIQPSNVDTIYHRIRKRIERDLAEALRCHKNKFDKLL